LPLVLIASLITAPRLPAQSAANLGAPAPSAAPQWQVDAGGKMAFDVASVKPDTNAPSSSTIHSNIPLGPMDAFTPTGGLLSATNYPLLAYMTFAYKLAPDEIQAIQSKLPKWANTDRYDIQGRASGNPTKDQFRLMMQALLADRFKLAMHYETRQGPVFALVLDKPGKTGPQLKLHPEDSPCSSVPPPPGSAPGPAATVAGGFPEICGVLTFVQPSAPGRFRGGGRNIPLAMFAKLISTPQLTGVDRPVIDKTGLTGKVDFVIEFTPSFNGPMPPGANFTPDPTGPTFMEALKEQLGLKFESQTGPVESIVIDHVEQPSEN
jgi:uncharacterized protein (TIGR03435 family)